MKAKKHVTFRLSEPVLVNLAKLQDLTGETKTDLLEKAIELALAVKLSEQNKVAQAKVEVTRTEITAERT